MIMSCNSCANLIGLICRYPEFGNCRDCLSRESIESWKKALRKNCVNYPYGHRQVDCPGCVQKETCQRENNWDGNRISTEYERYLKRKKEDEEKESITPYYRIHKRDDGKYDVYLTGNWKTFHFVVDGEFILHQ